MKELHKFLKVFIFFQLGACLADVYEKFTHFTNNPGLYDEPLYYGITLTLARSAGLILLTTIAYFVVGHIIKKREQTKTD
ncbi:MAG: hypothetical protein IJY91_03045 [Oscillospiraceae bacterium]|nr:hypothetical protein [Oscillospiraceae bacterium]